MRWIYTNNSIALIINFKMQEDFFVRFIPRLIMLAYIYAFYQSVTWFMQLPDPTNSQAMYISTIVGAGAAFFGLYVGKPGATLPKNKK